MTPPKLPSTDGSSGAPAGAERATTPAADAGQRIVGADDADTAGNVGAGVAGDGAADVRGRFAEGLTRVAELDDRPLVEHVDAYQRLHADLQAVLADVDGA